MDQTMILGTGPTTALFFLAATVNFVFWILLLCVKGPVRAPHV